MAQVRFPNPASCGLCLLVVFVPAPGVFAGFSGFPASTKIDISKFQFELETVDEEPHRGYAAANSHYLLFIYLFICLFTYLASYSLRSTNQENAYY